jgi:hypothetical protein
VRSTVQLRVEVALKLEARDGDGHAGNKQQGCGD